MLQHYSAYIHSLVRLKRQTGRGFILQVSCAVTRRTSRRSKPNWDLVRKSGEYKSPTPAPSENGSSYGSSYEPSYSNGNGSSSSYSPPAPAYTPPEPVAAPSPPPREVNVEPQSLRRVSSTKNKGHKGRWRGIDADQDRSDDQVRLPLLFLRGHTPAGYMPSRTQIGRLE